MSLFTSILNSVKNIRRNNRNRAKAPLVNDPLAVVEDTVYGRRPEVSYESLFNQFKNTPEIIGIFTAIVEDIISDGWYLEGGRNAKIRAEKFLRKNNMKALLNSLLFDTLITGDGYVYKTKLKKTQIKSLIRKTLEKTNLLDNEELEIKSNAMFYQIYAKANLTENLFSTKNIISLPSSTMTINYDLHGTIKKYIQTVGAEQAEFNPNEIIHFKTLQINGEVYGFTPFQSVISELSTLADVKDLAGHYFSSGGVPNYLFILKNETPDSPNYKKFVEALGNFKRVKNKYKNLVVTGDVATEALNKLDKDMEFRELAVYLTQIMFMLWGVPPSRLPNVVTNQTKTDDVTTTEGYYRKISHYQDLLEDLINNELMEEFDVVLKFKRTYKQDEVREAQVELTKTDVCDKRLSLGLVNNKWCWKYLQIDEQDRGDGERQMEKTGLSRQDTLNNMQQLSESTDKAKNTNMQKQSTGVQNNI